MAKMDRTTMIIVGVVVVAIIVVAIVMLTRKDDDDSSSSIKKAAAPAPAPAAAPKAPTPAPASGELKVKATGGLSTVNGKMLEALLGLNKLSKPMHLQKQITTDVSTGVTSETVKYVPNKLRRQKLSNQIAMVTATVNFYEPYTGAGAVPESHFDASNRPAWASGRHTVEIPAYINQENDAFDVVLGSFVLPRAYANRPVCAKLDFVAFGSAFTQTLANETAPSLVGGDATFTLNFSSIVGTIAAVGSQVTADTTVSSVYINVPRDLIKAAQDAQLIGPSGTVSNGYGNRLIVKFWVKDTAASGNKGAHIDTIMFNDALAEQGLPDNMVAIRIAQDLSGQALLMEAHAQTSASLVGAPIAMVATGEVQLPTIAAGDIVSDFSVPIGTWVMTKVDGAANVTMAADGNSVKDDGNVITIPMPANATGIYHPNQAMLVELVLRAEAAGAGSAAVTHIDVTDLDGMYQFDQWGSDVSWDLDSDGATMTEYDLLTLAGVTGGTADYSLAQSDASKLAVANDELTFHAGAGVYHVGAFGPAPVMRAYFKIIVTGGSGGGGGGGSGNVIVSLQDMQSAGYSNHFTDLGTAAITFGVGQDAVIPSMDQISLVQGQVASPLAIQKNGSTVMSTNMQGDLEISGGSGVYYLPVYVPSADINLPMTSGYVALTVTIASALRRAKVSSGYSDAAGTIWPTDGTALHEDQDVHPLQTGDLHFYAWVKTDSAYQTTTMYTDAKLVRTNTTTTVNLSFINNIAPKRYVVAQFNMYAIDMNLNTTNGLVFPTDADGNNYLNGARWTNIFQNATSNHTIMGVERLSYMRSTASPMPEFDLGAQTPSFPQIPLTQSVLAVTTASIPMLMQSFVGPSVNNVSYGIKYNNPISAENPAGDRRALGRTLSFGTGGSAYQAHEWADIPRGPNTESYFFPHVHPVQGLDVVYATNGSETWDYSITTEDVTALDSISHIFTFTGRYAEGGGQALRTARSSDLLFSARSASSAKKSEKGAANKASKRRFELRAQSGTVKGSTRK